MGLREKALRYNQDREGDSLLDTVVDPANTKGLKARSQAILDNPESAQIPGLKQKAESSSSGDSNGEPPRNRGYGLLNKAEQFNKDFSPAKSNTGLLQRAKQFRREDEGLATVKRRDKGLLAKASEILEHGQVLPKNPRKLEALTEPSQVEATAIARDKSEAINLSESDEQQGLAISGQSIESETEAPADDIESSLGEMPDPITSPDANDQEPPQLEAFPHADETFDEDETLSELGESEQQAEDTPEPFTPAIEEHDEELGLSLDEPIADLDDIVGDETPAESDDLIDELITDEPDSENSESEELIDIDIDEDDLSAGETGESDSNDELAEELPDLESDENLDLASEEIEDTEESADSTNDEIDLSDLEESASDSLAIEDDESIGDVSVEELPEGEEGYEYQAPAEHDEAVQSAQDEWEEAGSNRGGELATDEYEAPSIEIFDEEEDFETIPSELSTASQRKVNNYLSLIELSKDLNSFEYTDDLWVEMLYTLMSHFGTGRVAIFAPDDDILENLELVLVSFKGLRGQALSSAKNMRFPVADNLYQTMLKEKRIFYVKDFPPEALSPEAKEFLTLGGFEVVSPIASVNNVYGLVFVGLGKPGEKDIRQFHPDDLEFLSILGDLFATSYLRLLHNQEASTANRNLVKQKDLAEKIFNLASEINNLSDVDILFDRLKDLLLGEFSIEAFSLVLLDQKHTHYRIFAGNIVNPQTLERFAMGIEADLVQAIKKKPDVYEILDFRDSPDIVANYDGEDLAIFDEFIIIPFLFSGWLVGFITIHKRLDSWDELEKDKLIQLANILAPNLASALVLKGREKILADKFTPLSTRIEGEIAQAKKSSADVAFARFRIVNLKRLNNLVHPKGMERFNNYLHECLLEDLNSTDFFEETAEGEYLFVLKGRNRESAQTFLEQKREKVLEFPIRESLISPRISYQIYSFPEDGDEVSLYKSLSRN